MGQTESLSRTGSPRTPALTTSESIQSADTKPTTPEPSTERRRSGRQRRPTTVFDNSFSTHIIPTIYHIPQDTQSEHDAGKSTPPEPSPYRRVFDRKRRATIAFDNAFGATPLKRVRANEDADEDAEYNGESHDEPEFEVQQILARTFIANKSRYYDDDDREYLVRWVGYGPEDDSWEPISGLGDAEECVQEYHNHKEPFTILEVDTSKEPHKLLVRHGIVMDKEELESPLYETGWTTEAILQREYTTRIVNRRVRDYHNVLRDAGNPRIVGQRPWARKGARRVQYRVEWDDGDAAVEEWLEVPDILRAFPTKGRAVVSDYRRGAAVTKAEPVDESNYDRERREKIALNQSLLRELGLAGV